LELGVNTEREIDLAKCELLGVAITLAPLGYNKMDDRVLYAFCGLLASVTFFSRPPSRYVFYLAFLKVAS